MKFNAKFAALAGAAILMGAGAFAQATDDYNLPQGFTFNNEIGSDVVYGLGNCHTSTGNNSNFNYAQEFAGIYDKVTIQYNSEKLWFELAPKFGFRDQTANWFQSSYNDQLTTSTTFDTDLNRDDTSIAWWGLDWGVRFSPFDIVDFYMNNDVWTPGSWLPIRDDHMSGGNLAGNGVAVVLKPIDGLRLAADLPFDLNMCSAGNFFNAEYSDANSGSQTTNGRTNNCLRASASDEPDYKFRLDIAADYTFLDMVTVGGSITNLINRCDRGYGLYGNVNLGSLTANLGYTYNGGATDVFDMFGLVKVGGRHKANASAMFKAGDFELGAEALFNVFKTQSLYDLYAAVHVAYDLLPGKFNIFFNVGGAMDMGSKGIHYDGTANDGTGNDFTVVGTAKSLTGTNNGDLNQWSMYYSKKTRAKMSAKGQKLGDRAAAWAVKLQPGFRYNTGKNEFGAKANLLYFLNGDGSYAVSFPVYWKWTF